MIQETEKRKEKWHPYKNWQDDDIVIQNSVKGLMLDLKTLKEEKTRLLMEVKLKKDDLFTNGDINKIMLLIRKEIQKKMYPIEFEKRLYKLTKSISIKLKEE